MEEMENVNKIWSESFKRSLLQTENSKELLLLDRETDSTVYARANQHAALEESMCGPLSPE
jgi:hypothetical protein